MTDELTTTPDEAIDLEDRAGDERRRPTVDADAAAAAQPRSRRS